MELLTYLAEVTARTVGLAALALAGVWVFRAKTAAARHAAVTAVTGGMLALAGLTAILPSLPVRVLPAARAVKAVAIPFVPVDAAAPAAAMASLPAARRAGIGWASAASAVYFGVALALLLRLAYGYLFTRRLVRASERQGELYESTWISVPMTVGWLRPKVLLPVGWKEWDGPKLAAILTHERMHVERADWAIAVLAAVNRSVFWFNPLAWWMERKLAALAEQACDDAALLETGARETYAQALLDMAAAVRTGRGRMVWEAMAMARTAEVRQRIERILDESRQIPRGLTRRRWAALMACSLPLLYLASAARLAPAAQAPAPPPPQRAAEQRYQDAPLVVLYFDLQSMSADDLTHVQNSAQTIAGSRIGGAALASIMTNNGGVKVVQDFTDDRGLLIKGIEGLRGSGGGAESPDEQLASLQTAVKMLDRLPQKKRLIYFASGIIARNGMNAQFRATVSAALQANVAFFPVDIATLREGAFVSIDVSEDVVRASPQGPDYSRLVMMNATPVKTVAPVYPAGAKAAGVEGNVMVDIVIGTDGRVKSAQVFRGNAMLAPAALQAVKQYVYQPPKASDGEPIQIETGVVVSFGLKDGAAVAAAPQFPRMAQAAGTGGDHAAQVLSKVDPKYPHALRAQGHQGTVTVEVTVGVDGLPKRVRVVQSDPAFNGAVIAAVRQWRFTPARKNGRLVESKLTIPVSFQLE